MKWEPIETAPKDGTPILVYAPDARALEPSPMWTVAKWRATKQDWALTEIGGYAEDDDLSADPTHWMPLPSPPDTLGQIEEPALAGDEVDAET